MNIHFVKSNCNNIDNFTTIQNNKNKNIEIAKIIYNTKTEKEDLSFNDEKNFLIEVNQYVQNK